MAHADLVGHSLADGIADYHAGNYMFALAAIRPLANEGNAEAQKYLAQMYHHGLRVEHDLKVAFHWYEEAALQNNAEAQLYLGNIFLDGEGIEPNSDMAISWHYQAAENGDPNAQNIMALRYQYGDGVDKDVEYAMHWHLKAASQQTLGSAYAQGVEFEQNLITALMWYIIATKNGNEEAAENSGELRRTMSPTDITAATDKARVCIDSGYQNCE